MVCGNNFTTHELIELGGSVMVRNGTRKLVPFSRDTLFLSIHDSCRHRGTAVSDASALTQTVITGLRPQIKNGIVACDDIIDAVLSVLSHFDKIAAAVYKAYHPVA